MLWRLMSKTAKFKVYGLSREGEKVILPLYRELNIIRASWTSVIQDLDPSQNV